MTHAQVIKACWRKPIYQEFGDAVAKTLDSDYADVWKALQRFHRAHAGDATGNDLASYVQSDTLDEVAAACLPRDLEKLYAAVRRHIAENKTLDILKAVIAKHGDGEDLNIERTVSDLLDVSKNYTERKGAVVALSSSDYNTVVVPEMRRRCVPLPNQRLTEALDGGPGSGEVLTFLAPTDGGKTTTLINCSRAALEAGKSVLHVTLQTSLPIVYSRYWCSVMNHKQATVETRKDQEWIRLNYKPWLRKLGADLFLYDGADKAISTGDVCNEADRILSAGNRLDAIIIDYADLLLSARKYQSKRDELQYVWAELRRASKAFSLPILTASQANRLGTATAIAGQDVNVTHIADSWAKATDSDFVIVIRRDAVDISRNAARFKIIKTKRSGGYAEVETVFDTLRCRVG